MAYALVGSAGSAVGSTTGVTPSYGQTPTAGNLLIAWACTPTNTAATISTPSGWSVGFAPAIGAAIFYLVAAGGDAAPTMSSGGLNVIAKVAEFSGNDQSSPLDQHASSTGVGSPRTATCSAADATTGELAILCGTAGYTAVGTKTITQSCNNATSTTNDTNSGASSSSFYTFGYAFNTTNSTADVNTMTMTTQKIAGASNMICSFKLAPPSAPEEDLVMAAPIATGTPYFG